MSFSISSDVTNKSWVPSDDGRKFFQHCLSCNVERVDALWYTTGAPCRVNAGESLAFCQNCKHQLEQLPSNESEKVYSCCLEILKINPKGELLVCTPNNETHQARINKFLTQFNKDHNVNLALS